MREADKRGLLDYSPGQLAEGVRRLGKRWKKRTGSLFLGLGRRKRKGDLLDEWCVKFYVGRKVKRPAKQKKVPNYVSFHIILKDRRHIIRLPTDVVVAKGRGHIGVQDGRISYIYNENLEEKQGSVAALVEESKTRERFLLTAGHVAARNTVIAPAILGERILDKDGNVVGTLAYAPDLSSTPVDAALVSPSTNSVSNLLQRVNDQPVTKVCPLQQVYKGARDGYTMLSWVKPRVMVFHAAVFDYQQHYKVGTVIFSSLLHFDCSATGGDSGSLVVDSKNRAVGLHIMGIEGSESFCIPIDDVLRQCTPGSPLKIVT
jgi:hypothetical protein